MEWLWWIGAAALLALIEVLSLNLVLIMFAGGALAAAVAALLGASLPVQVVVFLVASIALLSALRPWLLRHLRARTPLVETNIAAQIGKTAVVVAPVSTTDGRVKLNGEVWTARVEDGEGPLPIGVEATVVRIDGATAVVRSASTGRPAYP